MNVAQADNHDTATTEEEIREARTLVTATEKVSISSEIAARVEKINFLMGDAFKKGDTLISFDCKLYNAQLEVCLLYTSPSPRDTEVSRMPSSA